MEEADNNINNVSVAAHPAVARNSLAMEKAERIGPEKLPDPWLADSEWLLEELAKTRAAVLRVPLHLNSASDINSVIDRIWNLEVTLRFLLHLHREGQRSFARKAQQARRKIPADGSRPALAILPARGRQ